MTKQDFGDCVSCGARITIEPPVAYYCKRCIACAEPFKRSFLEHAATTSSQYDSTCRRLAFQVLQTQDQLAAALQQCAKVAAKLEAVEAHAQRVQSQLDAATVRSWNSSVRDDWHPVLVELVADLFAATEPEGTPSDQESKGDPWPVAIAKVAVALPVADPETERGIDELIRKATAGRETRPITRKASPEPQEHYVCHECDEMVHSYHRCPRAELLEAMATLRTQPQPSDESRDEQSQGK
jgi:hypothetical protein